MNIITKARRSMVSRAAADAMRHGGANQLRKLPLVLDDFPAAPQAVPLAPAFEDFNATHGTLASQPATEPAPIPVDDINRLIRRHRNADGLHDVVPFRAVKDLLEGRVDSDTDASSSTESDTDEEKVSEDIPSSS